MTKEAFVPQIKIDIIEKTTKEDSDTPVVSFFVANYDDFEIWDEESY